MAIAFEPVMKFYFCLQKSSYSMTESLNHLHILSPCSIKIIMWSQPSHDVASQLLPDNPLGSYKQKLMGQGVNCEL